jgi:hypothetical protein
MKRYLRKKYEWTAGFEDDQGHGFIEGEVLVIFNTKPKKKEMLEQLKSAGYKKAVVMSIYKV